MLSPYTARSDLVAEAQFDVLVEGERFISTPSGRGRYQNDNPVGHVIVANCQSAVVLWNAPVCVTMVMLSGR